MTTTTVGWTEHEDNLLWVFRALDRRTFEEVARQLGRTVDSVKNRFTRLKQTRDENNYFDRFWNAGFERDSLQLPLQKNDVLPKKRPSVSRECDECSLVP
jgi:glutamine synthetase adenylyltransferase